MDARKTFPSLFAALIVLGITLGCAAVPTPAPTAAPPAVAPPIAAALPTAAALATPPAAAQTARAGVPTTLAGLLSTSFTPGQHAVARRVTIDHPEQIVGTAHKALKIGALALPAQMPALPAKGKDTVKLIAVIWEPDVRFADTNEPATTFATPLTITVEFTADDSAKAVSKSADGKPNLSIITYYPQGATWKWERLPTTVTCTAPCSTGTLRAQIRTLRPADPVADGSP